ncbi:hypothetical protein [Thermostilla marina]
MRYTRGGLLWAASAIDDAQLAEFQLDAAPVFDGVIAAREGCSSCSPTVATSVSASKKNRPDV